MLETSFLTYMLSVLYLINPSVRAVQYDICNNYLKKHDNVNVVQYIFDGLSKDGKLIGDIDEISKRIKELPTNVLHQSKFTLQQKFNSDSYEASTIGAYASRLLDDLHEFYHRGSSSHIRILNNRLINRFEELTASIVASTNHAAPKMRETIRIIECMRTNKLVTHSLDVFPQMKSTWSQYILKGWRIYNWLLNSTELLHGYLNLVPNSNCQLTMGRLLKGCEVSSFLSSSYTTILPNTELPIEAEICTNYCLNVVRGCLAPLFFHIPSSSDNAQTPWHQLTGSHPGYSRSPIDNALKIFMDSLNATHLIRLIQEAVRRAEQGGNELKMKIELFCGEEGQETTLPETTVSLDPDFALPSDPINDQSELSTKVRSIGEQLYELASRFRNPAEYVTRIEDRLCTRGDEAFSSNCWNGDSFSGYQKPVMPFTRQGQMSNPEVSITAEDLKIDPFVKNNRKAHSADISKNDGINSDEAQYVMDRSQNHGIQSSGLYPDADLIFPGLEHVPSLLPPMDDRSSNNKVVGSDSASCLPDDEDCQIRPMEDRTEAASFSVTAANQPSTVASQPGTQTRIFPQWTYSGLPLLIFILKTFIL